MTNPSLQWFQHDRFGMFIHWGLYSVPARGEWAMYNEAISPQDYARYVTQFQPGNFQVREWVDLAVRSGMKYVVLTARHHDGFCLWDSATTDFTAPQTVGRDFVAEYVAAAREAGLKVGLYYSLLDWRSPAYWNGPRRDPQGWADFIRWMHAQVKELISLYGKIDILWYDGYWPHNYPPMADPITAEDWRSVELNQMVRSYQPGILINNRAMTAEDFGTPQDDVVAQNEPWEACLTMNDNWGFHAGDHNWKSPRECLGALVHSVNQGGNLILNMGPRADGSVPEETRIAFETIGSWLKHQGESIYGCGKPPRLNRTSADYSYYCTSGVWTAGSGSLYFHILRWTGSDHALRMEGVRVKNVTMLLNGNTTLPFEQVGSRVVVHGLPAEPPDALDTVLKFEILPQIAG
jgi:alpha-L-fucosidase